jgi:uncharacterized cupredoxin-like copper-binding protein
MTPRRAPSATILAVFALLGVAAGGAAPATEDASTRTVRVTLDEFTLVPAPRRVAAGRVTFVVRNAGSMTHELVVLRTNTAPGKLRVRGARASERGRIGEISSIAPGKTRRLTLNLADGKLVLLCNISGHYQAGQFSGFTVR